MPHASVASQVLVRIVVQPLVLVVVPSVFTVAPPQPSDALGAVKFGEAVHSMVAFEPAPEIVGAVTS